MVAKSYGTAQSDGFVLNEATLMLGALGQFKDLTVEEHSVGLFKNLALVNNRTFTPLTQGVRQKIIDQQLTSDTWEISGTGFEYNLKTLSYALGQEGFSVNPITDVETTTSAVSAVASDTITVVSATGLVVGDWIVIKPKSGQDSGMVFKITAIAALVLTLDRDLTVAVAIGDYVSKTSIIQTNPTNCSGATYMSGKIVTTKTNCDPIVIWLPKIQVTSGLNLTFGSSDYSSIPYTLQTLSLTPSDAGYADYLAFDESEVIFATT